MTPTKDLERLVANGGSSESYKEAARELLDIRTAAARLCRELDKELGITALGCDTCAAWQTLSALVSDAPAVGPDVSVAGCCGMGIGEDGRCPKCHHRHDCGYSACLCGASAKPPTPPASPQDSSGDASTASLHGGSAVAAAGRPVPPSAASPEPPTPPAPEPAPKPEAPGAPREVWVTFNRARTSATVSLQEYDQGERYVRAESAPRVGGDAWDAARAWLSIGHSRMSQESLDALAGSLVALLTAREQAAEARGDAEHHKFIAAPHGGDARAPCPTCEEMCKAAEARGRDAGLEEAATVAVDQWANGAQTSAAAIRALRTPADPRGGGGV